MRIFLDTNVLANATATRGLCADVFRKVLTSHDLVVSEELLQELSRILTTKFGLPEAIAATVVQLLNHDSYVAVPVPSHPIKISDASDIPILSAAINGNAEIFVTGDKEILQLAKIGELSILSPRQFWEFMIAEQKD